MNDISSKIELSNSIGNIQNLQNNLSNKDMDDDKLKDACVKFEAVFIQKMFNEMAKTVSMKKQFGKGSGGAFFKDMFTYEMANDMAKNSTAGIAENMYNQLKSRNENPSKEKIPLRNINGSDVYTDNIRNYLNRKKTLSNDISQYENIIEVASKENNVDSALVKSVIKFESAGDKFAQSPKGAKGLMQLMDGTAKDMGVKNSFDPLQNIKGGTKYLRILLDKFDNNVQKAVAAYNAGPGNVEKYGGVPPFDETKKYVKKVIGEYEKLK